VQLTAETIEARRFKLAPNGYDCETVDRFMAEIAAALRAKPTARAGDPDGDDFGRFGDEMAALMRAAHDRASAVQAEAEGHAAAVRSKADLAAEDVKLEAEREAASIRVAADQDAASVRETAEREATRIVAEAQQRVLALRAELDELVERLGLTGGAHAETAPPEVVDLTEASGPSGFRKPDPGFAAATDPNRPVSPVDLEDEAAPGAPDPLVRMVRAAVGRASAGRAELERDDDE
jgi:DivIVA domain-containing protein